jgi:prophage regulatory protein
MEGDDGLLVRPKQTARLLGIGTATLWRKHAAGQVPEPVRIGRAVVRWRKKELEAWIAAGCPARANWRYEEPLA